MSKKIFNIIGVICLLASAWMYYNAKYNGALRELREFWWWPLPAALVAFLLAASRSKK